MEFVSYCVQRSRQSFVEGLNRHANDKFEVLRNGPQQLTPSIYDQIDDFDIFTCFGRLFAAGSTVLHTCNLVDPRQRSIALLRLQVQAKMPVNQSQSES